MRRLGRARSDLRVAADVAGNQPYGCRMTVDGSKDDLRGVFEMRDARQRVLANVELRQAVSSKLAQPRRISRLRVMRSIGFQASV